MGGRCNLHPFKLHNIMDFFFFFNTNHNFQIGGVVAGKLVCVVVAYGDFWFFPMLVGK